MTNPAEALAEMDRQEQDRERAKVLDAIAELEIIDGEIKPLEKRKEQLAALVKSYLELNADELDKDEKGQPYLMGYDGSTGRVLQERHAADTFDCVALVKDCPDDAVLSAGVSALVDAAEAGMVSINASMVAKHSGATWIDRIKRVAQPGAVSVALAKKADR